MCTEVRKAQHPNMPHSLLGSSEYRQHPPSYALPAPPCRFLPTLGQKWNREERRDGGREPQGSSGGDVTQQEAPSTTRDVCPVRAAEQLGRAGG